MLRHTWPLLLAALAFASACGPEKPSPDAGTPIEDAGTPACDDGIQNGDETSVDCGGSCETKCALGGACAADTDCTSGICSGGVCVECTEASQCPGEDSECAVRTCEDNTCGMSNTAAGTPVAAQTEGDCQVSQCDGNGAVETVADDADLPADDGSECTDEVCSAGVASHPAKAADTACTENGGGVCDGAGACVACNTAEQCPGSDTECQSRTCTAGVCGFDFAPAGTAVTTQTAADCQIAQCDGAGAVETIADDTDLPADDGSDCTDEVCTAGVPSHEPKAVDTACTSNGGSVCDATGACVACNTATQCPGTDGECAFRTCVANTCGMENVNAGVAVATQTAGDCQVSQCDGAGAVETVADDNDLPADDGNECTEPICTAGVPSFANLPADTACAQNGGAVCDGSGACVGCTTASQCPGTDDECQTRTCTGGACGFSYAAAGTVVTTQTTGDCSSNECDGSGAIVAVEDNADLPADDGNECTAEACAAGAPSSTPVAAGTPCAQNGGSACDGAGACVSAPTVVMATPADGAVGVPASSNIEITFSDAMNPATITGQTTAGACSGSVQLSNDGFASCVAFSSATAAMTSGDTIATFTPAPGLLVNNSYKIRVTTAAEGASGLALGSEYTQPSPFTTAMPYACVGGSSVVISQVYGAGGNSGATYDHDFVELHNRSGAPVNLTGMSLQYASTSGTSWSNTLALTGTIPPGGYFLVQLGGGSNGGPLPTPDQTGNIGMAAANGKIALMNTTTQNPTGTCPPAADTLDFVGFGTANCFEGSDGTPPPSATLSVIRAFDGCQDNDNNEFDFVAAPVAPRNSATLPKDCSCAVNEMDAPAEADYCNVQFPLSLSVPTGTNSGNVYGRIFEATVTEASGSASNVIAQLGYGPESVNPQYQSGWSWTPATFNVQNGNDDEYQASFTAPAEGSYRYAYRFSLDNGASWTYCDANQGDTGAGSNAGLTFSLQDLPVLTVPPAP